MKKSNPIQIYTDGSHWGNKGGYGIVMIFKDASGVNHIKKFSEGSYVDTTSNRMEMRAILHTLIHVKTGFKIDIYSDSEYCVKGMNEWLPNWLLDGTLQHRPNPDLWQKMWDELKRHEAAGSKVRFNWIRGHAGNTFNEMADSLAKKGRSSWDPKVCKTRGF